MTGQDGGESCSGEDCCVCGCLTACGAVVLAVVLAVVAFFLCWAVYQPHQVGANAAGATLSNFTLSGAPFYTLSYHLALNLSLRNPSLRADVYYDRLDAALYYSSESLGPADGAGLAPFLQRRKATTVLQPVFAGHVDAVSVAVEDVYKLEERQRWFNLEVRLNAKLRYKFGGARFRAKARMTCWLSLPPPPANGTAAAAVELGSKCDVKY